MGTEPDWLRLRLAKVFEAKWAGDDLPKQAELQERFVFHITDIVDDVRRLNDMLASGEEPGTVEFEKVLYGFFLHAVPHLVAAGQLYDLVPETFPEQKGVHALAEDRPDSIVKNQSHS